MNNSIDRCLGQIIGTRPGPTLIITGGVHGNEPAGIKAIQRVLAQLDAGVVHGEILGLAGNMGALKHSIRGQERDLNRQWTPELIEVLNSTPPEQRDPEQHEQRALLDAFEAAIARAKGPVVGLDLHTTSSDGPPFSVASDTLRNRELALAIPVAFILGLEESVDGTLLDYYSQIGCAAITVETGRHDDPRSLELHVAVIFLLLAAVGIIADQSIPNRNTHLSALKEAAGGAPQIVEFAYRHDIVPNAGFRMRPGYQGFQVVQKGEALADDRNGVIRASTSGRILMPLYQDQGTDGFFLARHVSRAELLAAKIARRTGLAELLARWPWIKHVERNTINVHRLHLPWLLIESLSLCGFRKRTPIAGGWTFIRREVH